MAAINYRIARWALDGTDDASNQGGALTPSAGSDHVFVSASGADPGYMISNAGHLVVDDFLTALKPQLVATEECTVSFWIWHNTDMGGVGSNPDPSKSFGIFHAGGGLNDGFYAAANMGWELPALQFSAAPAGPFNAPSYLGLNGKRLYYWGPSMEEGHYEDGSGMPVALERGGWRHVALTMKNDGTGWLGCYIDGELVTNTASSAASWFNHMDFDMKIGNPYINTSGWATTDTKLRDFQIHKKALSLAEVNEVMLGWSPKAFNVFGPHRTKRFSITDPNPPYNGSYRNQFNSEMVNNFAGYHDFDLAPDPTLLPAAWANPYYDAALDPAISLPAYLPSSADIVIEYSGTLADSSPFTKIVTYSYSGLLSGEEVDGSPSGNTLYANTVITETIDGVAVVDQDDPNVKFWHINQISNGATYIIINAQCPYPSGDNTTLGIDGSGGLGLLLPGSQITVTNATLTDTSVVGGETINLLELLKYGGDYSDGVPSLADQLYEWGYWPPEITLTGGSDISIIQGLPWSEPGFSASDEESGDLTGSVVIDSSALDVNALTNGTPQVITYTVTDGDGNQTVASRNVSVVAPFIGISFDGVNTDSFPNEITFEILDDADSVIATRPAMGDPEKNISLPAWNLDPSLFSLDTQYYLKISQSVYSDALLSVSDLLNAHFKISDASGIIANTHILPVVGKAVSNDFPNTHHIRLGFSLTAGGPAIDFGPETATGISEFAGKIFTNTGVDVTYSNLVDWPTGDPGEYPKAQPYLELTDGDMQVTNGAGDPEWNNVKLLLSNDLTDHSSSAHAVSNPGNNVTISNIERKFGTGSLEFDGTDDFLTIPAHSDWNLSSGDFTIETWVRFNVIAGAQRTILTIGTNGSTGHLQMGVSAEGKPLLAWNSGTNWLWSTVLFGETPLSTDQWYHFAAVFDRTNTTAKLYVDGTEVASAANPHSGAANNVSIGNIDSTLFIGSYFGIAGHAICDGNFDDFRITKGVARYTADFSGSLPTQHLTDSAFAEPGYSATDQEDGDLTASVVVAGQAVDANTDGNYTIIYTITDNDGNVASAQRVVSVVTPPPEETLTLTMNDSYGDGWNGNTFALKDSNGASVPADGTGNLTSTIAGGHGPEIVNFTVPHGDYTAEFAGNSWPDETSWSLTNANGEVLASRAAGVNTTPTSAAFMIGPPPDTTPPVITLIGNANVTVENGAVYADAGVTASDDVDGDISANVTLSGDVVDTNINGTYTLRYNVSDAAGNPALEVIRTVIVQTSNVNDWTFGNQLKSIVKVVQDGPITCFMKKEPDASTTLYFTGNIKEYGSYIEVTSGVSGIEGSPSVVAISGGTIAVGTTDGKIYEIVVDIPSSSPQSYTEIYSGNDSIISLNASPGGGSWTFGTDSGIVASIPVGGGAAVTRVDLAVIVSPGSHAIDVESVAEEGHTVLIRNSDFTFKLLIITPDWSQVKSGGEISAALRNINPLEISYNSNLGKWVAAGGDGSTLVTSDLSNWLE
jgi:hypothetical protein